MSRSAIILRNVASNWVGFAVNAGVTLVLTPFILHELGVTRYGIWVLTSSIVGYYGLLDLGFRAGVTQYLTRHLALRDYAKSSECLSTGVAALSALGALLATLSVGAAFFAPRLFGFPAELHDEAFWCILIVGLTSSAQFVFMPFTSVFVATQRFDLANLIGIGTRVLTALSIFIALERGHGLVGVSLATCGGALLDYVIRWRVALRLVPQIELTLKGVRFGPLREIGSFGAWNFLISVNAYVSQYVPSIIIAAFMPVAAVGHYALATGLSRQINSMLSPIGQVLYPAATELHVQGDFSRLERLYYDGSRLMMLVMIPIVLIAGLWSQAFYRLWIGEQYLSGEHFHSVAFLLQLLLIGTVSTYISNIGSQILIGAGRVRLVALALLMGSVLSLTLSLVLIGRYGLSGVALSLVIASIATDVIAIPIILKRALGFSILGFLRRACLRPAAAGVLQLTLMLLLRPGEGVSNWLDLVVQGVLAGVGSAVVVVAVGMTAIERQRFLINPLQALLRRLPAAADADPSS